MMYTKYTLSEKLKFDKHIGLHYFNQVILICTCKWMINTQIVHDSI